MIRCPQCQAEIAEGKRFCPQCGARLPEPPAPASDAGRTVLLPPEAPAGQAPPPPPAPAGDVGKTMVVPPAPASDAGRTVLLPPETPAGQAPPPPPAPAGDVGKTMVVPPAPAGDVGRTVLLPPEAPAGQSASPPPASAGDVGKTMVVPPAPPSETPSSSAGLQTILSEQFQKPQTPAAGVPPSSPQPSAGGGFGLPPAPSSPPTSPASSRGPELPPSTPPVAGGGFGLPSSASPPAAGSPVTPPVAPAKKGPNWLLIIGIILGVLVLGCILVLGFLYVIGQQAVQSLGTTVSGTVVSIDSPPGTSSFPNVLLRDSLASEASSGFTAEQTDAGDYRFENGAYVIEAFEADQIVWQVINTMVDDASFEIEATVSKPRSAAVALLFRYQDNQNFYILSVDGTGRYRVARYVDDAFSVLRDWTSSPSINAAGSPNRLKIEMAGDELTFYCNGQRLTTLRDSAFQSGELAFGTETFDEGQGVVRFSNLLVRGR